MKIGIYSGSFDPIHVGHLLLANYIVEFTDIDELWLMVTPQNPLKEDAHLLSEEHRLQMVKLAVTDYPKLKASDYEFSLTRPSYTENTLNQLAKDYPQHEFTLVIGGDNWMVFDQWRNYQNILANYRIMVYPRIGFDIYPPQNENVIILYPPTTDVSSTYIRQGVSDGKDMRPLLSSAVNEYVLENKLYEK